MKDKFVGIANDIKPGDTVVVLCDKKKGMAIVKSEVLEDTMDKIMPDGK